MDADGHMALVVNRGWAVDALGLRVGAAVVLSDGRYGVGLEVLRGGSCPGLVGPGWGVDGARTESCAIVAPISNTNSTTMAMNVGRRTVGG